MQQRRRDINIFSTDDDAAADDDEKVERFYALRQHPGPEGPVQRRGERIGRRRQGEEAGAGGGGAVEAGVPDGGLRGGGQSESSDGRRA